MNNITSYSSIKRTLVLLSLFAFFSIPVLNAQTTINIDVLIPDGGFEIDGDVKANTSSIGHAGDWIENGGPGGFVLTVDGALDPQVVNPYSSWVSEDLYNTSADNKFGGGDKFFHDPNTWNWNTGPVLGKNDMNHVFVHFSQNESTNDQWLFLATDRFSTNGSSYVDFELFQGVVTADSDGGFTSDGPDGGRTVGDILLTVEYSNGGHIASVIFYRWHELGLNTGEYGYGEPFHATTNGFSYGLTNTDLVNIPYTAFDNLIYEPFQFVEAAINISAIFNGTGNNCDEVVVNTLLVKSKSSSSPSANLSDFIGPVPVFLAIGHAIINYDDACHNETSLPVQLFGLAGGTFTSDPAGLSIDSNTGEINPSLSIPGTYWVTYNYGPPECQKTTNTQVTIYDNPPPPTFVSDIEECEESPIQTLNANDGIVLPAPLMDPSTNNFTNTTAPASLAPDYVVWYDAEIGGNIVDPPIWNQIGYITYWAETVDGDTGCRSTSRTAVTLTIYPEPTAVATNSSPVCCNSEPLFLYETGGDAVSWNWSSNGPASFSDPTSQNPTITGYVDGEEFTVVITDGNGCTSSDTTTITVTEGTFTPPANGSSTVSCQFDAVDPEPVDVIDSCGTIISPVLVGVTENPDPLICGGTIIWTYRYTSCLGTTSVDWTYTYTIEEDTTPPTIDTDASDLTVECDGNGNQSDLQAWLDSNGGASASDTCVTVTWSNDFTGLSDDCGATGSATVTFTATDDCGNASTTTATFTIEDTIAPTIDTDASDLTVECDGNGNQSDLQAWLDSNGGASASDICSSVVWSNDFTGLSDDCGATGSATVTFTATDDCGNTSTTTAIFTIKDTIAPTIDTDASDLTVECDGNGNQSDLQAWLDSNGGASASDNCSDVTWSNDFTILLDDCGQTGSATVIFTAADGCGNEVTTSATFTIVDTTAPVITVDASDLTVECDGNGNQQDLTDWLSSNGGSIVIDDCSDVVWSNDFTGLSDDCGLTGSATVTFTATDECGNSVSISATFTIEDTTAPILTGDLETEISVACDGIIPDAPVLEFEDSCSSDVVVIFEETSTDTGNGEDYEIIRVWTVTDDCGNETDFTQTIFVESCGVLGGTFEIYNGITPDGDGLNDIFLVEGISLWPDNNMKIYNRWGVLVWETDGYGGSNDRENVFQGISNGRATINEEKELPTGTYYYILTFPGENPGKSSYAGYLYINR